jgi:hypothetical protein
MTRSRLLLRGLLAAMATAVAYLLLPSCASPQSPPALPNKLSQAEKIEGWRLLFDGQTTQGWRGFGKQDFPKEGWVVEDGWLKHKGKGGGDIITRLQFIDFELTFTWRIAVGGNSGVKYFIDEQRGSPIGHEYQLIDDERHPDAKRGPHRKTAALYDALAAVKPRLRPAGQVNTSKIVVRKNRVEHWLNSKLVLRYQLGSAELAEAKARSKFKDEARWGTKFPTPILLQDHGDEIWFRDLKIREL